MIEETTYMDPGQCTRCKADVEEGDTHVCCSVVQPPCHFDLCQDYWNEMVLMDAQQHERHLQAINPDGSIVGVRAW